MGDINLTCPSCGARRVASKTCPVCGFAYDEKDEKLENHPQHEAVNQPEQHSTGKQKSAAFCPQCGKLIQGTPKFCDQCGTNLETLRRGTKTEESGDQRQSGNKPLYMVLGAVVVLAGLIILGIQIFANKPAAPEAAQNTPQQSQEQQPPAKTAPTPEQLEAIKHYSQALANSPSDTSAMLNLANVYYDIDDYQNAIPYYREYVQSNARVPSVLVDYAYCLFRNGQSDDAIAQMKNAIKIDPKFQQAYFNLSIVNLSTGNAEEGMEWMKKCVAVDSTTKIAQEAKQLLANHAQLFQQQQQ